MVDLLTRIEVNDKAIERINAHGLPTGATALRVAELVAGGLGGFRLDGMYDVPRITQKLRLPAFRFDKLFPFTWPERR